jgi:hypothetical protein
MKLSSLLSLTAAAALAMADDGSSAGGGPPVLRKLEPDDSVVFELPAPVRTAGTRTRKKVEPIAPVARQSPLPARLDLVVPPAPEAPARTVTLPATPALPQAMRQEVAFYCQQFIGKWKASDASRLLGEPLRNRPAFDENKTANGHIYAFHDPTGRYKELELDFDGKTGALRTVFVYPPRLTWSEVRRQWGGDVSSADAREGRKFYSYLNRRMDVLVDASGKVISLGLY